MKKRLSYLTLFILAGCTANLSPSNSNFVPQDNNYPISENGVAKASIYCDKSTECPANVGYLLGSETDESGQSGILQCTAFLIGKDVIATNSHCIPSTVKSGTYACGKAIAVMFPRPGGTHEVRYCKEIIEYSKIDLDKSDPSYAKKADYAFFKISRPVEDVPPVQIKRDGLPDMAALTILSFDPMSNYQLRGRLIKKTCTAAHGNILDSRFGFAEAEIGSLFGTRCELIPGNSGSPVFDSENNAVAIAHATLKGLDKALESKGITTEGIGHAAYVTNLACPKIPGIEDAKAAACAPGEMERLNQKSSQATDKQLEASIESQLQWAANEWGRMTPNAFTYDVTWKISSAKDEVRISAKGESSIRCVVPKNEWYSGNPKEDKYTTLIEVPAASLSAIVDRYARLRMSAALVYPSIYRTVNLRFSKLSEEPKEIGTITVPRKTVLGRDTEIPLVTRLCKAGEDRAIHVTVQESSAGTESRGQGRSFAHPLAHFQ